MIDFGRFLRMKRAVLPLLAGALLCTGCSRPGAAPKAGVERPVVAGVRVSPIGLQMVAEAIEAVGTVRSRKQSVLSSKIVAAVFAVHVKEGDLVHAGQVLAELDDRDVTAQCQRAEAGLREARSALEEVEWAIQAAEKAIEGAQAQQELALAAFNRYQALLEQRLVAPQAYDEVAARYKASLAEVARARAEKASLLARKDQVRARIEQAQAEVANARVLVGYARIRAPVAGIVVAKSAEVGNLAAPGVPLFTLEEEQYRLEALLQESEIRRVHWGQKVEIVLDALGQELSGSIAEIVPAADPLSRTFTVKIDLPPTSGLRAGLYGKARFIVGQRRALVLPRKAVVERGQLQGVFVLDHLPANVAYLRLVKTGRAYGEQVEILSGLEEGERVVVEGVEKLSDGSRVEDRR